MLSIAKMSAGSERYYLDLAREDYYLEAGEPQGRWIGSGAAVLGLSGVVGREQLEALMRGRDPSTGRVLVQAQEYTGGRRRTAGWDLTFSAPKSVSVLWSQLGPEHRAVIEAAQQKAVAAAVSYLEATAGFTRRGKGGASVEGATFVVATFEHGTSRAQDPNLHTHALLQNVGPRADGSWGTIQSREIYRHKMAAGAVYRAELAREMQMELGTITKLSHARSFELADVPRRVVEFFSKRRAQIEQAMDEFGSRGPRVADYATLETRTRKEAVARKRLFEEWQELGAARGFGPRQATGLVGVPNLRMVVESDAAERFARGLAKKAVPDLLRYQSFFSERRLVEVVAVRAQAHPIGAEAIVSAVRQYLDRSADIVPLRDDGLHGRFTTKHMLDLERRMLARATVLRGDRAAWCRLVPGSSPAWSGVLDDAQRAAHGQLISEDNALRTLSGTMGTQRSAVLAAAVATWRNAGFHVVVCGISPTGAREAEKQLGVDTAATVAGAVAANSYFQRARDLYWHFTRNTDATPAVAIGRNTIVVVDNAERVDTGSMHDLLRLVRRTGASIVLAGDTKGTASWLAGSPFRLLCQRFGGARVDAAVDPNRWQGAAVTELDLGNGQGVLDRLCGEKRLSVAKTRQKAIYEMVVDWAESCSTRRDSSALFFADRETADWANRLAQQARIRRKERVLPARVSDTSRFAA